MKDLIKKYDQAGPRYTSYPPVPYWRVTPSTQDWLDEINYNLKEHGDMDVYIHIPFCEKLCYYCGCHRTITKNRTQSKVYVENLIAEWDLYLKQFKYPFMIKSLHLGGGTPTFLNPEDLEDLLSYLSPYFSNDFIGAIEIDPRTCKKEHLRILRLYDFKRVSLGIQDFDQTVQTKINRYQPFNLVKDLMKSLRELGFESINFDLIYGLPAQTQQTVLKTLEQVEELSPDTIAFYSYAHLPEKMANQRLIKNEDLPQSEQKLDLHLLGKNILIEQGYIHIGMDHFAKPHSFLAKNTPTRSFMGYTDKKSPLLIGLGVSSIGQSENMFVQNEKNTLEYEALIAKKLLPIIHGHKLSLEEKVISNQIQDLFCRGEVNLNSLDSIRQNLKELEMDELITWKDHQNLQVTNLGKNFLRNIALAIDPLMVKATTVKFSKTI